MRINKKHSINNLMDYLRNRLSNKERFDLEKEITKDPFLEDAMDGFAQLTANELEHDLEKLNKGLTTRLQKNKKQKIIPYLKIAAGIAIIIGLGSVIIFNSLTNLSNKEIAENIEIDKKSDTSGIKLLPINEARKLLDEFSIEEKEEQVEKSILVNTNKKPYSEQKQIKEKPIKNENANANLNLVADMEVEDENTEPNIESINLNPEMAILSSGSAPATEISAAPQVASAKELTFTIQGVVVDADTKEPLPGANITQGNNGIITDINGNFEFKIVDDSIIQIAYIGYEPKEISISELAQNNNQIEMQVNQLALEEVTIVSYESKKQSQLLSSVSKESRKKRFPSRSKKQSNQTDEDLKSIEIQISYNTKLDVHAIPSAGVKELEKRIAKELLIENKSALPIVVEFMVDTDGSISEFKIIQSSSNDLSNEIKQLLKNDTAWNPAKNKDVKEKEYVTLTIYFR